jgi:hypothetical protein
MRQVRADSGRPMKTQHGDYTGSKYRALHDGMVKAE